MADPDDELRARLRAADPAVALAPADPARVSRLLDESTGAGDPAPSSAGRPLAWLAAVVAVVAVAGAGVVVLTDRADTPSAPTAAQGDPTVTELTVPARSAGRCMVPSARTLSGAAVAVDGVAASVRGGVVELDVSRWYAGERTDVLRVDQAWGAAAALVGATRFEEGKRYLVAGTAEGDVMVCGFSGPWTRQLASRYREAFGG